MAQKDLVLDYPQKIDSRVAQAIAIVTFTINYTILLRPEFEWFIYLLTIDFIIRYIHPKFSIVSQVFIRLAGTLNLEKKYYFAPPKRFATLIGVFFTLIISFATFFQFTLIQLIFIYLILIASFLQGFLDYCVGCEIYNLLIKIGIINGTKIYSTN